MFPTLFYIHPTSRKMIEGPIPKQMVQDILDKEMSEKYKFMCKNLNISLVQVFQDLE